MKLNIPYHSQFDEITMLEWKERGCAPTCLKMCMDFYAEKNKLQIPSIDNLIKEGEVIGAYVEKPGWRHDGLIRLAHNYGVPAYSEEFRSMQVNVNSKTFSESMFQRNLIDIGVQRIREAIDREVPVIVSVSKPNSSHQIVVIGYEDNLGSTTGFYINDPDNRNSERRGTFMPLNEFLNVWRKFAIFVG